MPSMEDDDDALLGGQDRPVRSNPLAMRSPSNTSVGGYEDKSPEEKKLRMQSLTAIYLTNFLSAVGFSIMVSTMWPYLQSMGGSRAFLGGVVASFSVGQLVGAPFWGAISNKTSYRLVLYITIMIRFGGNVLYAFAGDLPHGTGSCAPHSNLTATTNNMSDTFGPLPAYSISANYRQSIDSAHPGGLFSSVHDDPALLGGLGDPLSCDDNRHWWLLMSRVITGFGAGSMGVCMAYVSGATTLAERGKAMGVLAASGGLGFIFGPLFGLAFFKIQEGKKVGFATLNYATLPAYMAALFCILNILILQCNFKEFRINEAPKKDKKRSMPGGSRKLSINADDITAESGDDGASDKSALDEKRLISQRDNVAVGLCLFFYLVGMFAMSVFETLATTLAMDEFGWSPEEADKYIGVMTGLGGLESVIFFAIAPGLALKHGARKVMGIGLGLVVASQLLLIAYVMPSDPEKRNWCFSWNKWCDSEPPLPFTQYIFSVIIVDAGFPLVIVMVTTVYSKVLGPIAQGTWMGILNSCGSLARAVGPLVMSELYENFGPRTVFITAATFTTLSACVLGMMWSRLVPHIAQREEDEANRLAASAPTVDTIAEEGDADDGVFVAAGVYEDETGKKVVAGYGDEKEYEDDDPLLTN